MEHSQLLLFQVIIFTSQIVLTLEFLAHIVLYNLCRFCILAFSIDDHSKSRSLTKWLQPNGYNLLFHQSKFKVLNLFINRKDLFDLFFWKILHQKEQYVNSNQLFVKFHLWFKHASLGNCGQLFNCTLAVPSLRGCHLVIPKASPLSNAANFLSSNAAFFGCKSQVLWLMWKAEKSWHMPCWPLSLNVLWLVGYLFFYFWLQNLSQKT